MQIKFDWNNKTNRKNKKNTHVNYSPSLAFPISSVPSYFLYRIQFVEQEFRSYIQNSNKTLKSRCVNINIMIFFFALPQRRCQTWLLCIYTQRSAQISLPNDCSNINSQQNNTQFSSESKKKTRRKSKQKCVIDWLIESMLCVDGSRTAVSIHQNLCKLRLHIFPCFMLVWRRRRSRQCRPFEAFA